MPLTTRLSPSTDCMVPGNAAAESVIFDMDGVLVDSYRAHLRSWQMVAAEEGRAISEEEFAATFGRTSREIIAGWDGADYTEDQILELDRRKEAAFREILARDFPAMPGACAMLDRLAAAGFSLAVGSSGPPENVDLVLDRLGRRGLFAGVVHGMDVTRGKPDPQVFLLAAARAGAPPARCAVVEDAPQGIEAARRAGMKAIGLVSTGRTAAQLAAADLVIESLDELTPETLRNLIAKGPTVQPICVCVHVHVKPEHREDFLRASLDNAKATVQEPGNLRFDVIQQADDPDRFILYEVWRDEAGMNAHKETPHYARWRDAVGPWMAEPRKGVRHVGRFPDAPEAWSARR